MSNVHYLPSASSNVPSKSESERYWEAYRLMALEMSPLLLVPILGWAAYAFILLIGPGKEM